MQRKKFFSLLAGIVASTVLINSVAVGAGATSTLQTSSSAQEETSRIIINNSELMPEYVPDDSVNLIQIDGAKSALTPDWVQSLIVTEVSVRTASTNGQFSGMAKTLNHLKEAGINGIWLSPINDNGSTNESRYLNYGPNTVSKDLTGEENYEEAWQVVKSFVDEAHARNIRVFLDIVTWGTHKDSPLYTQHEDWYSGEEVYGGYAFNWNNSELYDWFKSQMINVIKTTGADGFRADCGTQFCGAQLFRDVRAELISDGRKISIFSECAEERDGTFDFEEHSVAHTFSKTNLFYKTADFYVDNNIVDAVKGGTTLGTADLLATGNGGKGRFYSSLISCHDMSSYGSENLVNIGYGAILAPFIPMWYIGEEWNNPVNSSNLYRTYIRWNLIDENREYYENIKKMIRVRRMYKEIFEPTAERTVDSNICKVQTSGDLQAYARYADNKAVIIVPNNGNDNSKFTITIPYNDASLGSGNYQITDLMNDNVVISGTNNELKSFEATVEPGSVGVYIVEKVATFTDKLALDVASSDYYEIRLTADQTIQIGNGAYFDRNLQQISVNATKEHNDLAKLLRKNIVINGVSVETALENSADIIGSTVIYTDNGNRLIIKVKKTDNLYGLNPISLFTLEIKAGITLNGFTVKPQKYYVTPNSGKDWNNKFNDMGETAEIVSAEWSDGIVTLTADQFIETDDALAAIGENILINGSAITTDIVAFSNKIRFAYDAAEDFELQVKSGIVLNGKGIMPARYSFTYYDAESSFRVGEYLLPETDENGANVTDVALTTTNSLDCSHAGENWVVTISFDKTIYSGNTNSYYDRHFQVDNTYGPGIRSRLFINGKSINECIGSGDAHSTLHVRAQANQLTLFIPKDNTFGFNGDSDFEITIGDILAMPDCQVNPKTIKYYAGNDNFEFSDVRTVFSEKNVLSDGDAVSAVYFEVKSQNSGYCGSHGEDYNPAQWLINITYSGTFETGYASYWNRHLQAQADTAEMICSHIKLNGKLLSDCIEEDTRDAYTAAHVVWDSTKRVLQIAVPKDNGFGFNGNKDFTVELLSGITLGGKVINPVYAEYTPATSFEKLKKKTTAVDRVTVRNTKEIYVYFEDAFDTTLDRNQAQNIDMQPTAVKKQIAKDLCSHIKINGETISDLLVANYQAYAVMCQIGNDNKNGFICLNLNTADNIEAIQSGEIFTVEILDDFVLDGYLIPKTVCTSGNDISRDEDGLQGGYWIRQGSFTNGTVVPRRTVNNDWSSSTKVMNAGESFYGAVTPDDGYQLKAGSLTYSYLYKGEKKVIPLLETNNGTNFYQNIADVIGQLDAKFVDKNAGINFATIGATSNKKNNGIRFVTRMYLDNIDFNNNSVTINGNNYSIVDYGTLIGLGTEQDLNVETSVSIKCEPTVYRTIGDQIFVDFTAQLVNIDSANAGTEFAARGYFVYKDAQGTEFIEYTDIITRSVNNIK